jgi:formylmethanofuran dehydrogenase subunit E
MTDWTYCSVCWRAFPEEDTVLVGYETVCWQCVEEHYCVCSACGELVEATEVDDKGRCWGCSEDDVPPQLPKL